LELPLPIARANQFGLRAAHKQYLLANLRQLSRERLGIRPNLSNINGTRLLQEFGIDLQVLSGRNVGRVKWTVETNIPILLSLPLLIAVDLVGTIKIINDALLYRQFRFLFLLLIGRCWKLQLYLRLQASRVTHFW